MGTQVNGRPLNPVSPRSPAGERVIIDEVAGSLGAPPSLGDLSDVADSVTPAKGSLLAGTGALYDEQPVGADGNVLIADSTQVRGLRWGPAPGAGLTPAQHELLRQLIHFIDEGPAGGFASGAYKEVIGGLFPTQIIWWESAAKLKRIVDKTITRSGGGATNLTPTPVVWRVYATDGVSVLQTVSDAITYSGVAEASRTRTIT